MIGKMKIFIGKYAFGAFIGIVTVIGIYGCGIPIEERRQKNIYQLYNEHYPGITSRERKDDGILISWLNTENVIPEVLSRQEESKFGYLNDFCEPRGGVLVYGSENAFGNAISAYLNTMIAVNSGDPIVAHGLRAGGYDKAFAAYAARDAAAKTPSNYTCTVKGTLEFAVVKEKVENARGITGPVHKHYYRFYVPKL